MDNPVQWIFFSLPILGLKILSARQMRRSKRLNAQFRTMVSTASTILQTIWWKSQGHETHLTWLCLRSQGEALRLSRFLSPRPFWGCISKISWERELSPNLLSVQLRKVRMLGINRITEYGVGSPSSLIRIDWTMKFLLLCMELMKI